MNPNRARRLLIAACVCALAALALMSWQLFDPTVVPVIVAMSAGQVLGTASFGLYLFVVVADFRARLRPEGDSKNVNLV
jgi:peptidoglycan/LPS O-acetylase OafA/YrhL